MNRNQKMLETGSFFELFLKLSLPAVVVILIMIVYNIADTFFIGQTGDPGKIAAISLSMPVFTILSALGTLFGTGGATAVSIALGEKETGKVRSVSTFCILGSLGVGILYFLLVFLFARPLAHLLGADADTIRDTITYLRVFSVASPFVLFSQSYANLIRADGDGVLAIVPNVTGTLLNIALDALFILVFHLDVFGAALATVIGNVAASVILVCFMFKKRNLLPDRSSLKPRKNVIIPVLTLGLPMTISTAAGSVANAIQNHLMIRYGSTALAAQSVSGKVSMIITMLILGFCMGMQPAISYNFGAKNYKRMYKIIRELGLFTIILGFILTVLVYFFKDQLIRAFINHEEVIALGRTFVLASIIVGPVYGIYQISQTFLQATGKANYAILASLLDKFLIYLPVLFIMEQLFGVYGIAFAHAATMVLTIGVTLVLVFLWTRQLRRRS